MKKLAMILCALSVMMMCAVPALAAGVNPPTGDSIKIVVIAHVIAIAAIVITLIFTRKKK